MAPQPRRAGAGAILLAAALLVLAACGAGGSGPRAGAPADAAGSTAGAAAPAAAPAPRRVQLAYVSTATSFVGLWAAREYGLFEQYGLRPEDLLYINGGPAGAHGLVAGGIAAGSPA